MRENFSLSWYVYLFMTHPILGKPYEMIINLRNRHMAHVPGPGLNSMIERGSRSRSSVSLLFRVKELSKSIPFRSYRTGTGNGIQKIETCFAPKSCDHNNSFHAPQMRFTRSFTLVFVSYGYMTMLEVCLPVCNKVGNKLFLVRILCN